ncbi:MAG: amyD [Micavibrio sp.]|nr:amyD [Micavibrio sp.]
MPANTPFEKRLSEQSRASARGLLRCISATGLTKKREAFAQAVTPEKGSVLASPGMGNWDPDPDYFFHWWRDAAVVMGALNTLSRNARCKATQEKWNHVFDDAVKFNLRAMEIDGRRFQNQIGISDRTIPEFRKYLRLDDDMAKLLGDRIMADTRVNPDATPDILTWARPQYDGPALLAVVAMEHEEILSGQGKCVPTTLTKLIDKTLAFTERHADEAGIDLWEVDGNFDQHYYASVIQLGAMHHGAEWANMKGQRENAERYQLAACRLTSKLDEHWSRELGVYKTARRFGDRDMFGVIDASAILAVNLARLPRGRHSVRDDRMQATVTKLEELFANLYPLNRGRSEGIAIGRNRDDNFFGNNPWYWTTAGLAEFYYRLAADIKVNGPLIATPLNAMFCKRAFSVASGSEAAMLIARGDAQMDLIQAYTPASMSLSEQFGSASGQPVSARHLGMSYAGFINATACRPR